jgi:antitoxin (DNA-binding transcriptional repressor) of toxin-antitoxin stability system
MSRVEGDDALVFTMRDLNQQTARIMSEIEKTGQLAFITRHGRFVAMITPLAPCQVESRVLADMAREIGERAAAAGPRPPGTARGVLNSRRS